MEPRGPVGRAARRWASTATGTSEDDLWEVGGREAIAEHLRELADDRARGRASRRSARRTGATVERLVLLRTIDSLWVEHLTELDDMRRGIGLRGYAQQDPLNEFRREAFRLYEELRGLIRHQVATHDLPRDRHPPAAARASADPSDGLARPGRRGARRRARAGGRRAVRRRPTGGTQRDVGDGAPAGRPAAASASGGRAAACRADPMAAARLERAATAIGRAGRRRPEPGFTPTGARIGRNDPCWCGSGQKYKKCHGR